MTPVDYLTSLTRSQASLNLRDRFILGDPGLIKFRSAVRGTLLVGVGFLVLLELTRWSNQPLSIAFLGVITTMMGALTLNEPSRRDQMVTLALLPLLCSLAAALSILIAPWHYLSLAVYLAVTFGAVYIRRLGPRGTALGTSIYMSYFCSLFFKISPDHLLYVVLGILAPGLIHFTVRLWIVPETPLAVFKWTLHSYRAALTEYLRKLADDLDLSFDRDRNVELLRRHTTFLNELALALHDSLAPDRVGQNFNGAQLRALEREIFELELAAQRITSSIVVLFHQDIAPPRLGGILAPRLRAATHRSTEIQSFHFDSSLESVQLTRDANLALQDLDLALVEITKLRSELTPLTGDKSGNDQVIVAAPQAQKVATSTQGLSLTTKQAIQATVATFFAIIFGTMVSAERWYWAPMTAFVLFAGASRGENLNRALHRVLGTVLGLIIGLGIAAAFNGHQRIQLVFVFVGIFFGIYTIRSAYIWTTMWFSVMVAIFFGLLGMMTPELFWLRVEETLIGAACGAFAAAFLFPISTSDTVRKAISTLLKTESSILTQLADGTLLKMPRRDRLTQVRKLERELAALRLSVAPFIGRLTATRSSELQAAFFDSGALVYYTRHLTIFLREDLAPEELGLIQKTCAALAQKAELTANAFSEGKALAREIIPVATPSALISVQNSLSRIHQLLERIALYSES